MTHEEALEQLGFHNNGCPNENWGIRGGVIYSKSRRDPSHRELWALAYLVSEWDYGVEFDPEQPYDSHCCHACFTKSGEYFRTRMICCPECGNKRCPKASNHTNNCTNSNEPNQKGSLF
jgi:hypothetical protein